MTKRILIVDGMRSGTGVRDGLNGGWLELHEAGISHLLQHRISEWQSRYEAAHDKQYNDRQETALLDRQGVELAKTMQIERPEADVRYFSDADMKRIMPVSEP